jgi:capsular exopolysaccharide synthesis family protein
VNRIVDYVDRADKEPIRHRNGDRTGIVEEAERLTTVSVTQFTATTVVTEEIQSPRVEEQWGPALEMDAAARRELTRLAQTLFLSSAGFRAVAFAGVEAGAGCSWIVVRVAELLASAGAGCVCIVDANFSNPTLHTYLDAGNGRGLSDALVEAQPLSSYVQRIGSGLHLLSAGSLASQSSSLLASSAFRSGVEELRGCYEFLLFDAPPLAVSSDALAVASKLDGLAMVVEANSTNRETALKAARDASADKVRMLGLILNKRTYPIPESIYKKL